MATVFVKNDDTTKRYANWNLFLGYNHYDNYLKNWVYVHTIIIDKLTNGQALVKIYLPDGYIKTTWASYNVAVEYFTKRSYRFKSSYTNMEVTDYRTTITY